MPLKRRSKRKHTESGSDQETAVDDSGAGSESSISTVPALTRNDIPEIVQEIARQLRPKGTEVHTSPLAPSMLNLLMYYVT